MREEPVYVQSTRARNPERNEAQLASGKQGCQVNVARRSSAEGVACVHVGAKPMCCSSERPSKGRASGRCTGVGGAKNVVSPEPRKKLEKRE